MLLAGTLVGGLGTGVQGLVNGGNKADVPSGAVSKGSSHLGVSAISSLLSRCKEVECFIISSVAKYLQVPLGFLYLYFRIEAACWIERLRFTVCTFLL